MKLWHGVKYKCHFFHLGSRNLPLSLRSSHQMCFLRKDILRNFAKFTGKHLCQSLFFNKVSGLRRASLLKKRLTLLKKRLWHRRFPVNFAKLLRNLFYRTPLDNCFESLLNLTGKIN